MLHTAGISKSTDQIAIIGIGCSFPGGVESPDALWQFLCRGGDAVVEVPADRWNVDAVYDPTPGTPGKTVCRRAGLLRDVASFDAGFFEISPREAALMDPQQRLLLQGPLPPPGNLPRSWVARFARASRGSTRRQGPFKLFGFTSIKSLKSWR